jgi:hypothetical protein
MSEEYARVAVLLEDLQTQVRLVAENQIAMGQRMDRMETRFDVLDMNVGILTLRFDGLEKRFDGLEKRFDGLETKFDGFAGDTQRRLQRIETHLELNGSSRHEGTRPAPPKPRKKTSKRT